ncbi:MULTISPECIES: site-specific integrase [unclassified Arenibacter]|uniref:site-specific integrase n=1 Tax=unclassified Arenibacter TaxID=2615047 RepID=UPI000E341B2C|nr:MULTISPECIES: site-specific integrase [unclassified Arenibacter]MCM4162146.1 integrase [Arenibacter sp. A80]RFT57760.1 site-specific integrase [Arenibacter sp. P308M17]
MNQLSISVLFYLNKSKLNQKGLCPIKCRITYQKKRKEFSTGLFVSPEYWNAKRQIVLDTDLEGKSKNGHLSIISQKLNNAFLSLELASDDYDINDIFDKYAGRVVQKEDNVVNYFRRFLVKKSQLVDKDIKEATYKKFEYVCNDLEAFILSEYKKKDFPLNKLNPQFLDDLEHYLKIVKGQKQVTINKAIQRFRKPIKVAVAEGYLDKDPFTQHKPGRVLKEVVFLSTEELEKLEKHQFTQPRLQLVKDLFIFCCYTGLAYHEMSNLKKEHIIKGFDGNLWIKMKREKTSKMISVPLLPKAKVLLDKYNNTVEGFALPKFSNQKINSYLKEISGIVGINKSISHHVARKTFASTVLLYNDVPMEIVSELLGHSSMKITQEYYGKIVQKRVSEEMYRVSKKLIQ